MCGIVVPVRRSTGCRQAAGKQTAMISQSRRILIVGVILLGGGSCTKFNVSSDSTPQPGDGQAGDAPIVNGNGDGGVGSRAGNVDLGGCVAGSPCSLPAAPCLIGTTICNNGSAACVIAGL